MADRSRVRRVGPARGQSVAVPVGGDGTANGGSGRTSVTAVRAPGAPGMALVPAPNRGPDRRAESDCEGESNSGTVAARLAEEHEPQATRGRPTDPGPAAPAAADVPGTPAVPGAPVGRRTGGGPRPVPTEPATVVPAPARPSGGQGGPGRSTGAQEPAAGPQSRLGQQASPPPPADTTPPVVAPSATPSATSSQVPPSPAAAVPPAARPVDTRSADSRPGARGATAGQSALESLWRSYKGSGDPNLREQLILHYSPLVKYVAGRVGVGCPPTSSRRTSSPPASSG